MLFVQKGSLCGSHFFVNSSKEWWLHSHSHSLKKKKVVTYWNLCGNYSFFKCFSVLTDSIVLFFKFNLKRGNATEQLYAPNLRSVFNGINKYPFKK